MAGTLAEPAPVPHNFPTRPRDLAREYSRLVALGVNHHSAAIIVGALVRQAERQIAEATREYAHLRDKRRRRRINARRKPCPDCGRPVRSDSFAKHRRTHQRAAQAA